MKYDVYVIIDDEFGRGRDLVEMAQACIRGGAGMMQLRCKDCSDQRFYELACSIRQITADSAVPFIVNDRVDIALAANADGVHVGQDDLPASVARTLLGSGKLVGVSAATPREARQAVAAGASYLGVGAVFATGTKPDAGSPIGPDAIAAVRSACPLPIVGIGGISPEKAHLVIEAGADGVAVVSAVMGDSDPQAATARLVEIVRGAKAALAGRARP